MDRYKWTLKMRMKTLEQVEEIEPQLFNLLYHLKLESRKGEMNITNPRNGTLSLGASTISEVYNRVCCVSMLCVPLHLLPLDASAPTM